MKMSPKDYKDMMGAIEEMYSWIIKEINKRIYIYECKSRLEDLINDRIDWRIDYDLGTV